MNHVYEDIGYHFLVGGDGNAYEGLGWRKEGAHTYHYNKKSICIAFIGNFIKEAPPTAQIEAAKKLIEIGEKAKILTENYRLLGHLQLYDSESPGEKLYKIITTWPHWSEDISPN